MFLYKVRIFLLNNSTLRVDVDRIYHIEQGIIDTKIHIGMLYTLTYTRKLTKVKVRTMFYHKRSSQFSHCDFFYLYVATFQQHIHMEYICIYLM